MRYGFILPGGDARRVAEFARWLNGTAGTAFSSVKAFGRSMLGWR
jgi:hypothetical protein